MNLGHIMPSSYMEHGFCLNWEKPLVFLHVGSDIVTGISYYSLAAAMLYFAYRRRDIPFLKIFFMFALFIFSCGTTHLFAAYTIYRPEYWTEGYVKGFTALVSALTVIIFIPRLPDAIALPSMVGYLKEIKELNSHLAAKNAELRRAMFAIEHVRDAVYWIGPDGRLLWVNEEVCKSLGYTAEEMLSFMIFDVDPDFPRERWPKHWEELKAQGSMTFETQRRTKDGNILEVEVTANYLTYEGEEFSCAIARDITSRKRAEEERAKLESQLHQAQKLESVGSLAGGVAHDFNNKLSVILGHACLALTEPVPDVVRENLEEIRRAAEQSAELTHQLLAFARKQTITPRVLDLNETVAGMLKMLNRLIGEDIQLTWQPGTDLWRLKFDPTQIDQILANLCVNARDAISGTGKITIETGNHIIDEEYCAQYPDVTPGEYVQLSVSDTGCGMDKRTLDRIFEPFFTTKEAGKGTGLGLATVFGIVKQNNGFINVYSESGLGTRFTIYLPRDLGSSEHPPEAEGTGHAPRGRETILLVEDEPAILNMAALMLQRQGYAVLQAGSPDEAVGIAREHAGGIDLLITDVIMPGMNGKDLAQTLQDGNPSLKCLYMSGYTADAISRHGMLNEGVNFIHKPFSLPGMAAKVREVLDK